MPTPSFDQWLGVTGLLAAYARLADARQLDDLVALFSAEGVLVQHRTGTHAVGRVARGHTELAEAFEALRQFPITTHELGQIEVTVTGSGAHARSTCMAHHISDVGATRVRYTMACRYVDTLVQVDGRWLFAERLKYNDWTETQLLSR